MGELVERFGAMIPLHNASRKWASHRVGAAKREYPTAYRMRFYTLSQELHWLQCRFDPPGRKTYQTVVLVKGMACPRCGGVFVGYKRKPTHGVLCDGARPQ